MQDPEQHINSEFATEQLRELSAGQPLSVLIVDDDEPERTGIREQLTQRGIVVGEAGDGAEALARLQKDKVPVVIVDWALPAIDGVEFIERFRDGSRGDTYVIMLTPRDEAFDHEGGYRAGVDDYLAKGPQEPELFARIHAGLHTYSLRVQLRDARAALASLRKRDTGG